MGEPHFYKFGEHGSGFRAPNSDAIQDFNQLREFCQQNGQLFEDKSFPAIGSSLYFSSKEGNKFKWMRPKELVDDPKFIVEGASRFDVCQGELGDCWLLASIANLTLNDKLFKRVVPHDQTFGSDYAGIFHFRFWQYGKWIDICVDDRLPTINGKLVLMHSKDRNEFWSALLEKAYAKLHGSYEALKGGTVTEAMTDFTGGLTEFYEIQTDECPSNLLQIMLKAFQRSSFMGCSIDALDSSMMESELPNGLIKGHAYSITAVRCVELKTARVQGKIPLIRIRNPWGNEAEWKGAWGDGSREWTLVSESEKKSLELNFEHDGEFWMTFDDFKSNFTKLEICHLTPEPVADGPKIFWNEVQFEGEWVAGVTAGGCRNNLQTFASNPQYIIELKDHDEGDEDDLCTLIVGLMQKNRRAKRKMGLDSLTIGFAVYAIKDGLFSYGDEPAATRGYARRQLLPTEFFKYNASVAKSPTFINLREVSSRMRLPPGQYCIIPSTFDANEEGEFILRIFTERPPTTAEENDDEVGYCPEDIDQQNTIIIDESRDKVAEEDIVRREVKPPSPGPGQNILGGQDMTRYIEIFGTVMTGLRFVLTNCVQTEETKDPMQQTQGTKVLSTKTADFFTRIAGEDMEVDAAELQEILNHALKKEFKFDGFSLDTCRSMIALLDDDRSGKLGLDEFTSLWTKIRHWCDVFKQHDKDLSGTINTAELRSALHETGLSVNRQILILIVHRYGDIYGKKHDQSVKHERYLTFDNFIHVCLKLKHSIELWNDQNTKSSQTISKSSSGASFTLDEWVERVMYC
ncbi:calpain-B-like isoform X3 [Panonychus citri]|uniref:calpain-B-like isoform X3 n=1 Tax=Panonychus citri TaxID=50023 RepID=UPI0023073398|nr:calpain-B-like isoform X3 [Panonychus citri]XP_053204148.1 calpain-B-like isoform X3 [Panonychus citri]